MWKNVGNDVQRLIFEQAKIDAKKKYRDFASEHMQR